MEKDVSSEPMDIDLSGQSIHAMDISYVSDIDFNINTRASSPRPIVSPTKDYQSPRVTLVQQPNIKYCHVTLKRRQSLRSFKKSLLKIITAISVAFISITIYYINTMECCDQLNLKSLNETLSNKLYGQSTAANIIIETLEMKTSSKVMFFSGGTGVGKTLASSLLLDFIGPCSNVYHYTMPTFESTFSLHMMFSVSLCKTSVVIVDDMTINSDMYVNKQIKTVIEKSESLGKAITVILIYNCNDNYKHLALQCDKLFHSKLLDTFSDVQALKMVVNFEPLSMENLKQCILEELGNRKLSNLQMETLIKKFNVSVDGCKGVHSKLKYLISV